MNKPQLDADRAFLVQKFPGCFVAKGEPKRPLKVNIHIDMNRQCVLPTGKRIKAFLGDYTRGPHYLEAVAAGGSRYGLDGRIAGQVDEVSQRKAMSMLGQLRAAALDRAELKVLREAILDIDAVIGAFPFNIDGPTAAIRVGVIVGRARMWRSTNDPASARGSSAPREETDEGLSGGARAARPPAAPVVFHEREATF